MSFRQAPALASMHCLTILFLVLAALGHAAFWVGVVNRWHATGFPRPLVKSVTLLFYAALVAPAVWIAWRVVRVGFASLEAGDWRPTLLNAYLVCAAAYGATHLARWLHLRWKSRVPIAEVTGNWHEVVDVAARLGAPPSRGPRTALASCLPLNQLWKLHVTQATLEISGLPPQLDGLSICHWSDLHISGRIDRGYYREVVRLTNELRVDLVALTGDICDKARYIDWIVDVFAATETRQGKFFILGNHDLRTHDTPRLRAAMTAAGFVDVGGRCTSILDDRVLIAGDERPWFRGEPLLPGAGGGCETLRVLLAHTPDRLRWARANGFRLMLSGHTHGGQICLPFVGPTVCPSWHGTRYASGYFHEPPTLLHVSRGTGSLFPFRLRCPPEITKLVLRPSAEL